MASFREAFLGKRFVCCALTIVYSIYNTVGRSIASIYDLGGIFTSGRIYRLWTSLPYYIYNIYTFLSWAEEEVSVPRSFDVRLQCGFTVSQLLNLIVNYKLHSIKRAITTGHPWPTGSHS